MTSAKLPATGEQLIGFFAQKVGILGHIQAGGRVWCKISRAGEAHLPINPVPVAAIANQNICTKRKFGVHRECRCPV